MKKFCLFCVEMLCNLRVPCTLRPLARGLSSASEKLAMRMEQVRADHPPVSDMRAASNYLPSHPLFSSRTSAASQELQQLFGSTASKSRSKAAAPPPLPAAAAASSRRAAKSLLRRMPEHMLPPYIEANFRLMTFVLTRAPKMSDFPRERLYRPESIDLLFRHYYMSKRA